MKKLFLCLLILSTAAPLIASCGTTDSCDCDITGRSFFAVRPQFQSSSPEMVTAFRDDRLHAREDGRQGVFQAVLFGSKSIDTKDIKRYFTPFCKTELIVDSSTDRGVEKDLLAQHFNIFTNNNFRSKISFEPKETVIGLGLHYRQSFWRNEEKNRGWFFSISSPITRVKNEFILNEKIINDGGGANAAEDVNVVANMMEAFKQTEWKYGKIDSKGKGKSCRCPSRSETKLADIELKLGIEWLDHEPYHLESYAGVLIPTGNTPTGEYIFEPIVGHGKHWGLMFGSAGGFEIWSDEENDRTIRVEYATHSQYLFRKQHVRSFDLRNKPFSRYMEVYENQAQAAQAAVLGGALGANLATPGINIFTRPAYVTPGFSSNITTAFVFTSGKGFQGEAGYNFYARRAECVKLTCPWKLGPALKHEVGLGRTNPIRDITGNSQLEFGNIPNTQFADYEANQIKESDLDLGSAAHPAGLAHTFFGALGYRWDEREYPIFISGGGSYEFSITNNATIDRWTLWGKFGFSF